MPTPPYHDIFGTLELLNDIVERGARCDLLAGFAFCFRAPLWFRKLALGHYNKISHVEFLLLTHR
jgi:hypothetical protein